MRLQRQTEMASPVTWIARSPQADSQRFDIGHAVAMILTVLGLVLFAGPLLNSAL